MSIRKFMSKFIHSRDLKEGVISCDCIEDVAHEIRRGNKTLKKRVIALATNEAADWNARGSALETLAAALIPEHSTELSLILAEILKNDGEDPAIHHTAMAIFGDLKGYQKDDLEPLMQSMTNYGDHRGKYAMEKLGIDRHDVEEFTKQYGDGYDDDGDELSAI